ncbi:MAG: tandem-95 repeat protein [Rubrobacter sp.]|nr:tandem-95 repeat protein [Rubrobacter sp.]
MPEARFEGGSSLLKAAVSREGDTLIVANATQGANGKVRCNPNGACTYTPNKDFNGSDSFTYTVRDAAGATDTAAISVSIAPVPDAPVANGDPGEGGETLETDRDTPKVIDVLDNDTDAEGDTLSVTGLQSPTDEGGTATVITPAVISASNGSLTSDDEGKILYEPNDGFFGDDTFTYKAKDSTGLVSAPATVTIAVNDVENTKPEGAIDEYSMDEGGTLTADDADGETTPADANDDGILANDDDDDTIFVADADAIEDGVQPESAPRHGTLELEEDGTFVYTPDDPDFFGEDEFTYKADDRRGNANLSDETTVTITVENAPDNPVANNDPENAEAYEVNEDGTLTVNAANGLIANDTDADNLTGPANAGLTVADKDGDASGIQPETAPTKGSLTLNANGSFTYTPNANFNGSDSFTYKAKDAEGNLSDAVEVSISVAPVADAPIARLDNATTDEDTPKVINVLANDGNPDGGPLTLTIAEGGAPDHGTAIVITEDGADKNKIRYTPSLHFHGRDSLTYEVCDSGGRCDQAQVRITVTPVNDPPEAANDGPYDADDDEPLTVSAGDGLLANDTDVDNEGNSNAGLTVADGDNDSENGITPVTGPTKGSLTLNANGAFEYTPNAAATGTDTFTYKATDGTATSNEATVAITINTVNKKPTAAPDEYSVGEDETLTADGTGTQPINGVLANDDDPIDDDLTATLVEGGGPEFGALDLESDGTFVYTPDDDFNGDDSFEYRADDGGAKNNLSDPAIVTITVEAENDAPTAGAASAATDENTPKNIDVLAANGTGDVDGDTLEVIVPEGRGPSHGTFRIVEVGGKDVVRYTPSTNYNGNDSFQYRVSDGTLQSPLATVSITVNPVNSPSRGGEHHALDGRGRFAALHKPRRPRLRHRNPRQRPRLHPHAKPGGGAGNDEPHGFEPHLHAEAEFQRRGRDEVFGHGRRRQRRGPEGDGGDDLHNRQSGERRSDGGRGQRDGSRRHAEEHKPSRPVR